MSLFTINQKKCKRDGICAAEYRHKSSSRLTGNPSVSDRKWRGILH